jgi:hypothetical protein
MAVVEDDDGNIVAANNNDKSLVFCPVDDVDDDVIGRLLFDEI